MFINGLETGVNKGIETRLLELGAQQHQRDASIRAKTRSTFLGSLLSGVSVLALAFRPIPWVENVLVQVWSMLIKPLVWLKYAFKAPRRRRRDLTSIIAGLSTPQTILNFAKRYEPKGQNPMC